MHYATSSSEQLCTVRCTGDSCSTAARYPPFLTTVHQIGMCASLLKRTLMTNQKNNNRFATGAMRCSTQYEDVRAEDSWHSQCMHQHARSCTSTSSKPALCTHACTHNSCDSCKLLQSCTANPQNPQQQRTTCGCNYLPHWAPHGCKHQPAASCHMTTSLACHLQPRCSIQLLQVPQLLLQLMA
jgi:hypothetical protein